LNQSPIFIFGVPRSGTTLVRTILNCHPRIACGPEAPWLANHLSQNVMALHRALTTDEFGYSKNFGVAPGKVTARLRALVDGLFMDFAAQSGKQRWAHKTPDDCLFVDFFTELFPDAKFIHLVRNPFDVALSTSRVPAHRKGISEWHENNLMIEPGFPVANTLFNSALRWQRWNARLETGLRNVDSYRVDYEALVTVPEKAFGKMFAFLGEEFAPDILDYGKFATILPAWEWSSADLKENKKITASRAERWKQELSPEQIRVLATVAGVESPILGASSSTLIAPAPRVKLANVGELSSPLFTEFMTGLNAFSAPLGLRTFTDWSKVWEYPWLWFNGLASVTWSGARLVDIGSEISPMPWFLALKGARVTLIETSREWIPVWENLRAKLHVDVDWHIVDSEKLPVPDACADVLTSFSVIEHQPDKPAAMAEVARVLKPGGTFGISFDICEPEQGMTFPEWNGRALTLAEFEREIWRHPAFVPQPTPAWNLADMSAFKEWHLRSAPHHNYVTGAALLTKR
jgi:SAM-dependent methyltransferase